MVRRWMAGVLGYGSAGVPARWASAFVKIAAAFFERASASDVPVTEASLRLLRAGGTPAFSWVNHSHAQSTARALSPANSTNAIKYKALPPIPVAKSHQRPHLSSWST